MSGRQKRQPEPYLGFQNTMKDYTISSSTTTTTTSSTTTTITTASDETSNKIVLRAKKDASKFFERQPSLKGADGESRHRFAADHFSRNVGQIDSTELFSIAHQIPKGAHLHIHFNSTLPPNVLLGYAKDMENMYLWSDIPLVSVTNLENCKIEFSLRHFNTLWDEREKAADFDTVDSEEARMKMHDAHGPNLFHKSYESATEMRYQYFRQEWKSSSPLRHQISCDDWLISKLVFSKEEADAIYQQEDYPDEKKDIGDPSKLGWTNDIQERYEKSKYINVRRRAAKAWDKFNGRTKMMKGLFNYERAFRAYIRSCLEEFVRDNVQYAEIRPNFMPSNQLLQDDGQKSNIDNRRTMEIIIEEYECFMVDIGAMTSDGRIKENRKLQEDGTPILDKTTGLPVSNGHRPYFSGLKVIYCTPRSFSKAQVQEALDQCIEFKKEWPQYIAGFDLVGEEAYEKRYPLKYFEEEFVNFKQNCKREGVNIPFLFHCGETPDDIEDNLDTALALDARRIGHGYALSHKPHIMDQMRANKVCVEVCPISNMILGLVENMSEHSLYRLLHHNVPCAVSSDNGTLFQSTLSHDFFEVMVGHDEMNIYGWEQLARWSIEHASLEHDERERMLLEWHLRWKEFIKAVKDSHGSNGASGSPSSAKALRVEQLYKAERQQTAY
ncbi:hypothetical protein F5X96DRAFT_675234 [Biscogniauxia mediterranea]|nr:hypothetical protein F5X96DRAFT_675234 [Biscogniauxia mediterranea]